MRERRFGLGLFLLLVKVGTPVIAAIVHFLCFHPFPCLLSVDVGFVLAGGGGWLARAPGRPKVSIQPGKRQNQIPSKTHIGVDEPPW